MIAESAPQEPSGKQVLAKFELDGKPYVVPIGVEKDGDYTIYADDMFFIEDPHELYKHWPAEVWKAIENHEVRPGMSELQTDFAIGLGVPGSGPYGSRTLRYPNGGKPLVIVVPGRQGDGDWAGGAATARPLEVGILRLRAATRKRVAALRSG